MAIAALTISACSPAAPNPVVEIDTSMGKITADYFVSDSGGKGNAVIEHVPAYPILNGFTDGFGKEVKAQCPACKTSTTNITIPDLTAGKVPSTLVSALRQNSDANYLVFDDGPFADDPQADARCVPEQRELIAPNWHGRIGDRG